MEHRTPGMRVRRAGLGDEPTLRALRLEALTEAPEAFGSTYDRELARTTADWRRWLAPGVTLLLEVSDEARGLVAGTLAHVGCMSGMGSVLRASRPCARMGA